MISKRCIFCKHYHDCDYNHETDRFERKDSHSRVAENNCGFWEFSYIGLILVIILTSIFVYGVLK